MCTKASKQSLTQFDGLPENPGIPNGRGFHFHPNPNGGVWNGKHDVNMAGRSGYTYGIGHLSDVVDGVVINAEIPGYVCHASKTFRTQSAFGQQLIGQEPEPNRVGLTSQGFAQSLPA